MAVTNEDRARWAGEAVEFFAKESRMQEEDKELVLGDLLCDLQHWADANEVDFAEALMNGMSNYAYESHPSYAGD